MAVLKQRLHRKNSSGSYDIVYLEGIANNIKMSDTDSTLLSTKISNMDTAIAGKQPAGSYAAASHSHSNYALKTDIPSIWDASGHLVSPAGWKMWVEN